MDDDGGMGMRNWAYFDQTLKGDSGLHPMSSMAAEYGAPKPSFLPNGAFHRRECFIPEQPDRMDITRNEWINLRENDVLHMLPMNDCSSAMGDAGVSHGAHSFSMMQSTPLPPPEGDKITAVDDEFRKDVPQKRSQPRAQTCPHKASKPKRLKKVAVSKDESSSRTGHEGRNLRQSSALNINGIDLDVSNIPTPLCSCTGMPHQCYRWGAGGWQSACCTTGISTYPLPMSTKRRGARIAGRKMSQGAFKKVLANLAAKGYNLSDPIDLKPYWAKHGTNKFVTIR
ncbi:hypothetical protein BHM03_00029024 [Ensete ventricosum]|nr:hypothetical protein BHM03_00029024 [Ensete ventricosum]